MNLEPAIIEPQRGKRDPDLPPHGMLVFTPQDLDYVTGLLDCHEKLTQRIYLTELHTGSSGKVGVVVAGPMLGAPQAVLVMEKMIALGVRHVIALGWCGSLQSQVHIGDVVVPRGAVSEEGTSRHYPIADGQPKPSPVLVQQLQAALDLDLDRIHEGYVWSTDAPFRETRSKVLGYQEQGVLAVDMEVSALFTVARFRGIELAAVLAVSDELHDLAWRHGFRDARFKQTRERLCQAVLAALGGVVPQS